MLRHLLRRPSRVGLATLAALAACSDTNTPPTAPRSSAGTVHFAQGVGGRWTVNTLTDPGDGVCDDTECTLREAIGAAGSGHVVDFAAGLQGDVVLSAGPLSITSSVTVDGGGRIGVDALFASRVVTVAGGVGGKPEVTLKRLTLMDGVSTSGGGIRVTSAVLTLDSVQVLGNRAEFLGGGLDIGGAADVTLRNSAIVGNEADRFGGGIYVEGGSVTVIASELSNNVADDGGAIYVYPTGKATVLQSTISNNVATDGVGGMTGGKVRSSTITKNRGTVAGGLGGGDVANSIIIGNTGTKADCGNPLGAASKGHNLTGPDCAPAGLGDIVVQPDAAFSDVLQAGLSNNGGPTKTHALFPRGRAVDKGDCPGETADQRGARRPVDDASITNATTGCDIGAYEVQGADLMVSQTVDKTNVKQGELLTYSVRVRNLGSDAAPNVVVTDVLSSGVTFVEAKTNKGTVTAPPQGETGTVTWSLGTMDSQANEVATVTVTVLVRGRTTITNTASATGDIGDPNAANNSASITVSVAPGSSGKKP